MHSAARPSFSIACGLRVVAASSATSTWPLPLAGLLLARGLPL